MPARMRRAAALVTGIAGLFAIVVHEGAKRWP
jgi:hypothetical protein